MSNTNTAAAQGHFCLCGCNQVITTKATYKPGHDAAHVSYLLQGLINQEADHGRESVTPELIKGQASALPSEALQAKYLRAADRLFNKPAKAPKATKQADPLLVVEGLEILRWKDRQDVKVGRWYYPAKDAVTTEGEQVTLRNTKRDGSGEWVVVA